MNSGPPLSKQAFEQVLQHAQQLEQQGKAFEEMAKSLELRLLTTEQAALLEQAGQQMQQYGQAMTALANQAVQSEQSGLEEYFLAHQHHHQAVLLHIKVIRILLQSTRSLL